MAPSTRLRESQAQPGSKKRQRQLETAAAAPTATKRARTHSQHAAQQSIPDQPSSGKENVSVATAQDRRSQSSSRDVRCRTAEVVSLRATLRTALQKAQSECIYIPGQPGTGKTHTVRSVLESLESSAWHATPAATLINCMDGHTAQLGKMIIAGLLDSGQHIRSSAAGACLSVLTCRVKST